jgi:hypothetical protein
MKNITKGFNIMKHYMLIFSTLKHYTKIINIGSKANFKKIKYPQSPHPLMDFLLIAILWKLHKNVGAC